MDRSADQKQNPWFYEEKLTFFAKFCLIFIIFFANEKLFSIDFLIFYGQVSTQKYMFVLVWIWNYVIHKIWIEKLSSNQKIHRKWQNKKLQTFKVSPGSWFGGRVGVGVG